MELQFTHKKNAGRDSRFNVCKVETTEMEKSCLHLNTIKRKADIQHYFYCSSSVCISFNFPKNVSKINKIFRCVRVKLGSPKLVVKGKNGH